MNVREYKLKLLAKKQFGDISEDSMVEKIIIAEEIKKRLPENNPPRRKAAIGAAKKKFNIPRTNKLADTGPAVHNETQIVADFQKIDARHNLLQDLDSLLGE
jgi:hypothetical protein